MKAYKNLNYILERDYRKEYDNYQSKPEQKKNRALRNNARKQLMKRGLVKKGDDLDVDHIVPLSKGGSNMEYNLQAIPKSVNRAKK